MGAPSWDASKADISAECVLKSHDLSWAKSPRWSVMLISCNFYLYTIQFICISIILDKHPARYVISCYLHCNSLTFLKQIHGDLPPTLEGRNKDLERFGVNVPGETRPSGFSGWRDVPLGCRAGLNGDHWIWQRLKPSLDGLWMMTGDFS